MAMTPLELGQRRHLGRDPDERERRDANRIDADVESATARRLRVVRIAEQVDRVPIISRPFAHGVMANDDALAVQTHVEDVVHALPAKRQVLSFVVVALDEGRGGEG
jgi:hypothetical protein